MRNWNVLDNWITRRSLLVACSTALAAGFTVSLPQPARAAHVTPPDVPPAIQVQAGNRAFLEGHGVGTQNYICLPCPNPTTPAAACPDASGFAWLLFTPEATLFNDHGKQLTTHSGKRLVRNGEWQRAAAGTPDPGTDNGTSDCNTGNVFDAVNTGSRATCKSSWGVFDMVGNVNEWMEDWADRGNNLHGLDDVRWHPRW